MTHHSDEFNAFYAAAVANRANDALVQWQATNADTFARSALQARRDYITTIRDLHLHGLDGALAPVIDYLTADITHLYIRVAAPTKGREKQYRVRLLSGETLDISPEEGNEIFKTCNRKRYTGYARMSDDQRGHAKWLRWELDGNNFGLLLSKEETDDGYVVAG